MGSEELALISLVPRISPLVCRTAHRCGKVSTSTLLLSDLQDKLSNENLAGHAEKGCRRATARYMGLGWRADALISMTYYFASHTDRLTRSGL